jgi:hypothetical protein
VELFPANRKLDAGGPGRKVTAGSSNHNLQHVT